MFNMYFSSGIVPDDLNISKVILIRKKSDSLRVLQLTTGHYLEIMQEISKLHPWKSAGHDNIGISLLIDAASFEKPLLHIYNSSIQTGNVPTKLKIAKVIPLYKKGEGTEPSNYRPISLLSVFSKLFEKLICRRLVSFLDRYNFQLFITFNLVSEKNTLPH